MRIGIEDAMRAGIQQRLDKTTKTSLHTHNMSTGAATILREGDYDEDGLRHGYFAFSWPSGMCLYGFFQHGRLQTGIRKGSRGELYEGEFKDGDYHGEGTLRAAGSVYVGSFKNGRYHGQGTITCTDGSRYEGMWRDGKRHGLGVCHYSSSEVFSGGWSSNLAHGLGTHTKDGVVWKGEWDKGVCIRASAKVGGRRRYRGVCSGCGKSMLQLNICKCSRCFLGNGDRRYLRTKEAARLFCSKECQAAVHASY